jgi:tetratricopeptide (TPR) repeat protein
MIECVHDRRILDSCHTLAVALTMLCVLTAGLSGASAQTVPQAPNPASERVQALGQEAVQLATSGDYELAIARFRSALELDPEQHLYRFQLARLLAALGRYQEAGGEFATVVRAMPENGAARRGEVTALLLAGRYEDSRRKLEEGLQALPRDGQLAHTLARLLASAPEDDVRDGELALRLASSVYEIKKQYETAETLAMAHAENGNFDKAIEIQRGLIARAEAEGDASRVQTLRLRLSSYQNKEAWRAVSPVEIATATEPPDAQPDVQR